MSHTPRARIRLAAAVLLLAAEAGVGVASWHPSVSPAYRDAFLSGASGCWLEPRARESVLAQPLPDRLDTASLTYEQSCALLPWGWMRTPEIILQTVWWDAQLRLPVGQGRHVLRLVLEPQPGVTVTAHIAGRAPVTAAADGVLVLDATGLAGVVAVELTLAGVAVPLLAGIGPSLAPLGPVLLRIEAE